LEIGSTNDKSLSVFGMNAPDIGVDGAKSGIVSHGDLHVAFIAPPLAP